MKAIEREDAARDRMIEGAAEVDRSPESVPASGIGTDLTHGMAVSGKSRGCRRRSMSPFQPMVPLPRDRAAARAVQRQLLHGGAVVVEGEAQGAAGVDVALDLEAWQRQRGLAVRMRQRAGEVDVDVGRCR